MNLRKIGILFSFVLVIVMMLSLFACTSNDEAESVGTSGSVESDSQTEPNGAESSEDESFVSESESESESESVEDESSSVSESESEPESESAPAKCAHTQFSYEDLGDGKCKKVCDDCKETLSSAKHSKGDPDPADNCNIKCTKCNAIVAEGKHTKSDPDANDNCNVKCSKCDKILLKEKHSTPEEDATWVADIVAPQKEYTSCTNCNAKLYRGATTTMEGLTLFAPDYLDECINNKKYSGEIKTDENGMTYYSMTVTSTDAVKEITITLSTGEDAVGGVGNYVAVLIRQETESQGVASFDFWINKVGRKGTADDAPAKRVVQNLICDGKWRLLVFDYSTCEYIDKENGVGWIRFDVNTPEYDDVIDIAFIGFFDSEEAIRTYYKAYLDAYIGVENCPHTSDNKQVASVIEGKVAMHCVVCQSEINVIDCNHANVSALSNITAVDGKGLISFTADCAVCGLKGAEVASLNQQGNKTFTASELLFLAQIQAAENLENNGNFGRYSTTLISNDATVNNMPYVKFTAKLVAECCLLLNDGTTTIPGEFLGEYVAILYRRTSTTVSPAIQLLYNKSGKTTHEGFVSGIGSTVNNDAWQLMILDLTNNTDVEITEGIGWTRLDIIDPLSTGSIAVGDEVDIAYVSFFDSKEAADEYYVEYLKSYLGYENCSHRFDNDWTGTGNVNEMQNACFICLETIVKACEHVSDGKWVKHAEEEGKLQSSCSICSAVVIKDCEHSSTGEWTPTGNEFEFQSVCSVCDMLVTKVCDHTDNNITLVGIEGEYDLKYNLVCKFCNCERTTIDTNANGLKLFGANAIYEMATSYSSNINGKYSATLLKDANSKDLPFVRMQLIEGTPRETFFWINEKDEDMLDGVGPYFMFVYRASSGCQKNVEVFISIDEQFAAPHGKAVNLVTDGEWHYVIYDFSKSNVWNGKDPIQQARIDIFNGAGIAADEYFDIAFIGFFSSANSAKDHYKMIAREHSIGEAEYYSYFDYNSCAIDGMDCNQSATAGDGITTAAFALKNVSAINQPVIGDLAGKTLSTVTSLKVGGWCLAETGVQSINYCIVAADGTKSELKKLCDGGNGSSAMKDKANGSGGQFVDDDLKGGAFQGQRSVDLSGYEGQTVTVQIVIVANSGQTAVIALFNNVSVPAAQ